MMAEAAIAGLYEPPPTDFQANSRYNRQILLPEISSNLVLIFDSNWSADGVEAAKKDFWQGNSGESHYVNGIHAHGTIDC